MDQSQEPKPKGGHLLDRPLDPTRHKVDIEPADYDMAPLALEVLVPGQPCPVDLYLPLAEKDKVVMTPACQKGEEFRAQWRDWARSSAWSSCSWKRPRSSTSIFRRWPR